MSAPADQLQPSGACVTGARSIAFDRRSCPEPVVRLSCPNIPEPTSATKIVEKHRTDATSAPRFKHADRDPDFIEVFMMSQILPNRRYHVTRFLILLRRLTH